MWKDLINTLDTQCEFRPPASGDDIEQLEKALKVRLPDSLRELLLESNGVYSPYGYLDVIWNTDEILRQNKWRRNDAKMAENYMSFESLLFFAGAGIDGILFAFPITASGLVQDRNIITWDPIEDM